MVLSFPITLTTMFCVALNGNYGVRLTNDGLVAKATPTLKDIRFHSEIKIG